jgi:hypothetical protein
VQAHLESALVHSFYNERRHVRVAMAAAQSMAQLTVEVMGVLGRRTKYQESETAQLVLQATPAVAAPEPVAAPPFVVAPVPESPSVDVDATAAAAAPFDEHASVVADAASARDESALAADASEATGYEGIPGRVAAGVQEFGHSDEDVLTRPAFMDAAAVALSPLHQAVLLGMWCGAMLRPGAPRD